MVIALVAFVLIIVAGILTALLVHKRERSVRSINNIKAGQILTMTQKMELIQPSAPATKTAPAISRTFQQTYVKLPKESEYTLEDVRMVPDEEGAVHILLHLCQVDRLGSVSKTAFSGYRWYPNTLSQDFEVTALAAPVKNPLVDYCAKTLFISVASESTVNVYSSGTLSLYRTVTFDHPVLDARFCDSLGSLFVLLSNQTLMINTSTSSTSIAVNVRRFHHCGQFMTTLSMDGVVNLYFLNNGSWALTSTSPVITVSEPAAVPVPVYTTNCGQILVGRDAGVSKYYNFGGKWYSHYLASYASVFPLLCEPVQVGGEEAVFMTEQNTLAVHKLVDSHKKATNVADKVFDTFKATAQLSVAKHMRSGEEHAYVCALYAKGYRFSDTLEGLRILYCMNTA